MRIISWFAIALFLLALATIPASAQDCPAQGSGVEGVEGFIGSLGPCEGETASTTCNGEFSVEMVAYEPADNLVTFTYQVCNLGQSILNHWVLGLDQMLDCVAEGSSLYQLVASCSVYGEGGLGESCFEADPDSSTLLSGVRFDSILGAGECKTFTLTLDETALESNFMVGAGCVAGATQANNQDINFVENAVPGYASLSGPVCQAREQEFVCPKSQGYWKNHPEDRPVDSLTLGSVAYTAEQLMLILKTPIRGDASLILARQLIAAKLNLANGSDPASISDTIYSADETLSGLDGSLPYGVRPRTDTGHEMILEAYMLNQYNQGGLTPGCEDSD